MHEQETGMNYLMRKLGTCFPLLGLLTTQGCSTDDRAVLTPYDTPAQRGTAKQGMIDDNGRCVIDGRLTANAELVSRESSANTGKLSGDALGLSECEVVTRAGPPDKIEIRLNARGERVTKLTYAAVAQVYRFRSARLFSIERLAEASPIERKSTTSLHNRR